jgi:hypothetical protein
MQEICQSDLIHPYSKITINQSTSLTNLSAIFSMPAKYCRLILAALYQVIAFIVSYQWEILR